MAKGLTPQQANFVKKLSLGNTQEDAAKLAGYSPKSASSMSSQLLRNPKVVKALEAVGLTETGLARILRKNIKAGVGINATADTSLRGVELAYRLKGYLDKPDNVTMSQTNVYVNQLRTMSNDELKAELEQVNHNIEQLQSKLK